MPIDCPELAGKRHAGRSKPCARSNADAMTLPESLLGIVTEQSTAAIFTDGADATKIGQVWWCDEGKTSIFQDGGVARNLAGCVPIIGTKACV